MPVRALLLACLLLTPGPLSSALAASESHNLEEKREAGRTVFRRVCAGCHTRGEHREGATDLAGVTQRRPLEWFRRWAQDPAGLPAHASPQPSSAPAKPLELSAEAIEEVFAYLDGP